MRAKPYILGSQPEFTKPKGDSDLIKKQLAREIRCLESQLKRVLSRAEFALHSTIATYEDMIEVRRKILAGLHNQD